jgi:hypothetical protein
MKRNYVIAALLAAALPSACLLAQQVNHDNKAAHANLYPPADIQWKMMS